MSDEEPTAALHRALGRFVTSISSLEHVFRWGAARLIHEFAELDERDAVTVEAATMAAMGNNRSIGSVAESFFGVLSTVVPMSEEDRSTVKQLHREVMDLTSRRNQYLHGLWRVAPLPPGLEGHDSLATVANQRTSWKGQESRELRVFVDDLTNDCDTAEQLTVLAGLTMGASMLYFRGRRDVLGLADTGLRVVDGRVRLG